MTEPQAACTHLLRCPVCTAPLRDIDRSLRCARNHTFDRAREGYVNLMAQGHGRTNIAGDSAAMVQARQRIMSRGCFQRISSALTARALRHPVPSERTTVLLDAGCGTGYYLDRMRAGLVEAGARKLCSFGLDVSKEAVRLAARTYSDVQFVVSDIRARLPFDAASVDVLLSVFAPRNPPEFARVLRHDGLLLVLIPQDHHLGAVRQQVQLLDIAADKRQRVVEQFSALFRLSASEDIEYGVDLPAQVAIDLVRMTPNYWHLDDAAVTGHMWPEQMQIAIAVTVLCFAPTSGA